MSQSQSATRRTFEMLELLAGSPDGMALADISFALDIPKSVTHRLLGMLGEMGYVRQDADTSHYRLTLKLTLLGQRYFVASGLKDLTQPILDRLAEETGDLARLALVEGERMVWVSMTQGARHGIRYDPDTGHEVILHATATGKAWLATLDEAEAVRIVSATEFRTPDRFGPNVVRTLDGLRAALAETRQRGFGLAFEEGEPGMAAMAVVIRSSLSPKAPAVGTISVAGPVMRFPPERREMLAAKLFAAAEELSVGWPVRKPPIPSAAVRPPASAEA